MTGDLIIPQPLALRLQLAAIAGREPAGGLFEIRHKLDRGGMRQSFHHCRRPDAILETIERLGREADTFVGCAPRRRRNGGKASIERVWCLWADLDGGEALARLEDFRPAPALVIRSGSDNSAHAWWSLREPLTAAQAEHGNRRLAHHLGADIKSTDAARILRPAGTLNQ